MRTVLLIAALLPAAASAADITASQASTIIEGCVAQAKTRSHSHAIVVVDSGGHVVASLRMDGNSYGIAEFALKKAEATAAWRFSTEQMLGAAKETQGFGDAPHVVTVPGGVPVFGAEGAFIGAVGVSGEAPADDAACAEAGHQGGRARVNSIQVVSDSIRAATADDVPALLNLVEPSDRLFRD